MIILYLTLFIFMLVILKVIIVKDNFTIGHGTVYGHFYPPKKCLPEDNCFPGYYYRTQKYQNMCDPYGELTRDKIKLQDSCLKSLGNNLPTEKYSIKCNIDTNTLEKNCRWVQNY